MALAVSSNSNYCRQHRLFPKSKSLFANAKRYHNTFPNFTAPFNFTISPKSVSRRRNFSVVAAFDALIFDCDGVILESEELHRIAYNATFEYFEAITPGGDGIVSWTPKFYDVLQNTIGGGKPKMRWYFKENGWPSSLLFPQGPSNDEEKTKLIDTFQDKKTAIYKELIASGFVKPRPGVVDMMDSAREKGVLVAVCSAATKSSVVFVLKSLLGHDRFEMLDCFLAGDDVDKKKPDPTIYKLASKSLGVDPSRCLVVEDSKIGLQAALGAEMRCVVTYTPSTQDQDFEGASAIFPDFSTLTFEQLVEILEPSKNTEI